MNDQRHVAVNPLELARPSGFSHAVRATGGTTVYLAGQTALDAGGAITGDDVVAQFELALGNLLAALRAAGGAPRDLVTMTIYIVDVPDYKRRARDVGRVWRDLIGDWYPAVAGVGVARLWDDDALVEVQAVAVLPAGAT
jgi:enamine deaminase RidA (YjgF/YER057c/UK114 family)